MTVRVGELKDLLRYSPDAAEVVLQLRDEPFMYLTGVAQWNSYVSAEPWTARVVLQMQEEQETEAEQVERQFWNTVQRFREELEETIAGLPTDHLLVHYFDQFTGPIDKAGDQAND